MSESSQVGCFKEEPVFAAHEVNPWQRKNNFRQNTYASRRGRFRNRYSSEPSNKCG